MTIIFITVRMPLSPVIASAIYCWSVSHESLNIHSCYNSCNLHRIWFIYGKFAWCHPQWEPCYNNNNEGWLMARRGSQRGPRWQAHHWGLQPKALVCLRDLSGHKSVNLHWSLLKTRTAQYLANIVDALNMPYFMFMSSFFIFLSLQATHFFCL